LTKPEILRVASVDLFKFALRKFHESVTQTIYASHVKQVHIVASDVFTA